MMDGVDDDAVNQDYENDSNNDRVPLVSQRIYMEITRDEDEIEDGDCFNISWKVIASILLAAILLGPRVYLSVKSHLAIAISDDNLLLMADSLTCAKDLQISYSNLFEDFRSNRSRICQGPGRCACIHPLFPSPRGMKPNLDRWWQGFDRNQQMIQAASEKNHTRLDVVFLGDSIFEHWLGTDLGLFRKPRIANASSLFYSLFHDHALALALSGDRCHQLLYRIQNGEMPDNLSPTVWWILIGTNDSANGCSKEAVLVGVLGILMEAWRRHHQDASFVIQGLLPRGPDRLSRSQIWRDYQWINDRLACITNVSPKLKFYNGTLLFLTESRDEINQTLLYDYLHPSLEGYKVWGPDIIEKLKKWGFWSE